MSDDEEETCYYANLLTCGECGENVFLREDGEEDESGVEGDEKLKQVYACTATAMCAACGETIEADQFPWVSMYEHYVCGLVLAAEKVSDKLKKCTVDVGGGEDEAVTIVTNDSKVREGDRLIVALVGARVPASAVQEEDSIVVKKTSVGGVSSQGMFCDAFSLRWGDTKGVAFRVPDSLSLGERPPRMAPAVTQQ